MIAFLRLNLCYGGYLTAVLKIAGLKLQSVFTLFKACYSMQSEVQRHRLSYSSNPNQMGEIIPK